MQHGNGKRWLLIGLLLLGGLWLVNDAYDDGYRDALVRTGQVQELWHFEGDPDFPWGLLILGGIGYIAWRKGAFDRLGGPGGPFGSGAHQGERGAQRPWPGGGAAGTSGAWPASEGGPLFRGPRGLFDDWHRQAHEEASRARQVIAQPAAADSTGEVGANPGASRGSAVTTPPPPPLAPEYWTSMAGAADAAGTSGASATPPVVAAAPQGESPNTHHAAGTSV